jgi:hypothetical protein
MDKDQTESPQNPRRRILTSPSRQQLEAKVMQLMVQGWERVGDIATAKSVIDSEPPYLSQAMVQIRARQEMTTED